MVIHSESWTLLISEYDIMKSHSAVQTFPIKNKHIKENVCNESRFYQISSDAHKNSEIHKEGKGWNYQSCTGTATPVKCLYP
jgi:hypothetical protein